MSKHQADNVTMSEGGLYSLATKGAKDVIDIATPRVLAAVSSLDIQDNRFTMADMGCADAGTSLDMVRSVLDHLEQARPAGQQPDSLRQSRSAISSYLQHTRPEAVTDVSRGRSVNYFV